MSEQNDDRLTRRSVKAETCGSKTRNSKNEITERLLVLLTTDVQDLANSLWGILESDKEGSKVVLDDLAKLKRENEDLRKDLEIKRGYENKLTEIAKKYKDARKSAEDEIKMRREYEVKYQELKQRSKKAQEAIVNENNQMKETIKKLKEELHGLKQAKDINTEIYRSVDDSRDREQEAQKRYEMLAKQHQTTREKLKKTEEKLDETKTRLNQALGLKLLNNNPNIADLSDKYRPTKLAEIYMDIYDKEWTEAFETIKENEGGDDESVFSTLLSILMETKSVCDKEAETQMKKIQLALTQDEYHVDKSIISNINKKLKECRKQVAYYSWKQVFKKYLKELNKSCTPTATRAKQVPEYLEACFNLCWLIAVQDPPVVFGPDIKRGDTFDTDLYKAYTKSGKTVAYVVWPALLLHEAGPVLCKGIAQGIIDHSSRPLFAPSRDRDRKEEYREYEINDMFTSPNGYNRSHKDDMPVAKVDKKVDTLFSNGNEFRMEDNYERQRDSSNQTYFPKGIDTYSTYKREIDLNLRDEFSSLDQCQPSDRLNIMHDKEYNSLLDSGVGRRDYQYPINRTYNKYRENNISHRYSEESDSGRSRASTKRYTPRSIWK